MCLYLCVIETSLKLYTNKWLIIYKREKSNDNNKRKRKRRGRRRRRRKKRNFEVINLAVGVIVDGPPCGPIDVRNLLDFKAC